MKTHLLGNNEKNSNNLTNKQILLYSIILFGTFVSAEVIGALLSGSLSLLGDASAMSVNSYDNSH